MNSIKDLIIQIFTTPIYLCSILIFILIAILKFFNPQILGWFGEHWVKKELKKLPCEKYRILNDIMIRTSTGTCQIDHLVISPYGIFVIEAKQYHGYITGDKYDKKWIRHLGRKNMFYENPIRQNYGHVKSICELLNLDESKVFNIVCIPSGNVKLNIKHGDELTTNLDIVERITSFQNVVIDNVVQIEQTILANNITDKNQRKEHIKVVKSNIQEFNSNMCPKCGGTLVEKNGKNGIFLGCSNYPRCKYTKNIH